VADEQRFSLAEVARIAGVTPATLKRWVQAGVVPQTSGRWTPAAVAHARLVARLRDRGYSLDAIRSAGDAGRLAFAYIEDLLPATTGAYSLEEAAETAGVESALAERVLLTMGYSSQSLDRLSDDDCALLQYVGAVLAAGFPLVAFLQLARVYGQALAQIADAEVRLFHLYVHEPLMRDGVPGLEMAEEMEELARDLLPLASPMMDHIHVHFLHHFVEQDVVGHMEADIGDVGLDLGRLRVAIAFADLAGYTKMTEEQGDEEAVGAVERFIEAVEHTLPDDARIIKTIGDEVMIVSPDVATLTDWAVGFQELHDQRPHPRIGIHYGETIYRDGDYYGRAVNQAARVAARAAGGEVLATRPVVEMAGDHLEFELIGQVRLKGFADPTEIFLAHLARDA
jgi:adenylate cyclase